MYQWVMDFEKDCFLEGNCGDTGHPRVRIEPVECTSGQISRLGLLKADSKSTTTWWNPAARTIGRCWIEG